MGRNSLIRHSDLRYKIQMTVWPCWEMVGTATRKIYLGKDSVRAINCKIFSDPFTCTYFSSMAVLEPWFIFWERHFYLRLRGQWFTNGVALKTTTSFKFFGIFETSLKRSLKIFNLSRLQMFDDL